MPRGTRGFHLWTSAAGGGGQGCLRAQMPSVQKDSGIWTWERRRSGWEKRPEQTAGTQLPPQDVLARCEGVGRSRGSFGGIEHLELRQPDIKQNPSQWR